MHIQIKIYIFCFFLNQGGILQGSIVSTFIFILGLFTCIGDICILFVYLFGIRDQTRDHVLSRITELNPQPFCFVFFVVPPQQLQCKAVL